MTDTERADELARLVKVRGILETQIAPLVQRLNRTKDEIIASRNDMRGDASYIVREFDDLIELSSLNSQVMEREKTHESAGIKLRNLRKMFASPYFGRIDFTEDGCGDELQVYIGLNSLFDGYAAYVYDWRAPVSSMFYDYGIGRAGYAAPGGRIDGEIVLKRQYKIVGGEIVYMFDSDLTIDDDILQMELSKAAGGQIKTIISTIQREQNEAIRRENQKNLLVSGPAGSGKTSVGLHRLAYLLYKYRGAINSNDMLIFSSNNIFTSYISNVIPELGEDDIPALDFRDIIGRYYKRKRPFHDMYEQIEYMSGLTEAQKDLDIRLRCIREKYSAGFINFTESFCGRYRPAIPDVYFRNWKVCDKKDMAGLYIDRTSLSTMESKTARIIDFTEQRLREFYGAKLEEIYEVFCGETGEHLSEAECKRLYEAFVSKTVQSLSARLCPAPAELYGRIIKKYAADNGIDWGFYDFTHASLSSAKLFFEDMLVLTYIQVLTGYRGANAVKHVLVDEAQDMTPLQHIIINKIFRGSRFTVLADINQAAYPLVGTADWDTLAAIYGCGEYGGEAGIVSTAAGAGPTAGANPSAQCDTVRLLKSYRSTSEINRFAMRYLPEASRYDFFGRGGEEPEIIRAQDMPAAVLDIIRGLGGKPQPSATVGILVKNAASAKALYKILSGKTKLTLISDADEYFKPGVVIMPAYFAKGLEFDAVIVPYREGEYSGAGGSKIMYLMCTRALHTLYLVEY